jgi:prolipoprotein diacylglyceryl transferase
VNLAAIPSPPTGVWHAGPVPVRAYPLCIIVGIAAAIWLTDRRLRHRGARPGTTLDIAIWAVPAGIIGARLYHVATDPELYFAPGRHPIDAFKIWNGGLGIWGAVLGGAAGAWFGCRRAGMRLDVLADALAPGLPVAQAIGRLGNYFNQELFGRPTRLPWGLAIDPQHRPAGYGQYATFHPTFAYELVWDLGVAVLVWAADRRWRLRRGRAFALYAMAYVTGRFWIEDLRIDTANHVLGLRLNEWTSVVVFGAALAYFVWAGRSRSDDLTGANVAYRVPAGLDVVGGEPDEPETAEGTGPAGVPTQAG